MYQTKLGRKRKLRVLEKTGGVLVFVSPCVCLERIKSCNGTVGCGN